MRGETPGCEQNALLLGEPRGTAVDLLVHGDLLRYPLPPHPVEEPVAETPKTFVRPSMREAMLTASETAEAGMRMAAALVLLCLQDDPWALAGGPGPESQLKPNPGAVRFPDVELV